MTVHVCDGCTRLFYPHEPIDGVPVLRCDAMIVTIDDPTWQRLESAAVSRTAAAKGLRDRGDVDAKHDAYLKRLLGACGEWAVAFALGLSFDEKPFGLDVGQYNVRTRGRHEFDLIVQDYDVQHHPSVPVILVTAHESWRSLILRGWITAREAARSDWRQTYGGYRAAFFVPQDELHDLRRLPERRAALVIDDDRLSATYDDVPDDE